MCVNAGIWEDTPYDVDFRDLKGLRCRCERESVDFSVQTSAWFASVSLIRAAGMKYQN